MFCRINSAEMKCAVHVLTERKGLNKPPEFFALLPEQSGGVGATKMRVKSLPQLAGMKT